MMEASEGSQAFGQLVAKERKRMGWTQGLLALKLGKTRAYVTRLERGEFSNPGSETIAILAREFHRSEAYFLEALGKRAARDPVSGELEDLNVYLSSKNLSPEQIRQIRRMAEALLEENER